MNIKLGLLLSAVIFLSACSSKTLKARQEQREKLAVSTGMFCDFVSGDLFPDIEVELSLQMARRCDSNQNFTVAPFKNSANHNGVIYCCNASRSAAAAERKKAATPTRRTTPADKTDADVVEAP